MDDILARSQELKQALVDFVLDAEGEIAQALESYAAKNSRGHDQSMLIESFILEEKVADHAPVEIFIAHHPNLSASDRQLIHSWCQSFIGLFAITQILPDSLELMNWLTAKYYTVKPTQEISRAKPGEIILTRIFPVSNSYWMLSSHYILMGKLGKPKLAVAIGKFKENYRHHLYSDAPDLLIEAWQSVAYYHQQFVDFFGSDEIILPGYQLNKKIQEFQERITEKIFIAAGIDPGQPLVDLAQTDVKAALTELGADSPTIPQISNGKMVMPKVDLPVELKKAEQVAALSHPRWGQMFLPTYSKMQAILSTEDWQTIEGSEKLIRVYLEDASINAFIWHRLANKYLTTLEKVLQQILQRPNFKLATDLDGLLQEFHKPLEPDLPEIASVPIHLHNLFQEAVAEVNKSKSKDKGQKKVAKGFQST